MSGKSLRELGGKDTQYTIKHEDPEMATRMQRVVDSTPEEVADIMLDVHHELYGAMKELIHQTIITPSQYNILGKELIRRQVPTEYHSNPVLRVVVLRTSADITGKIYEALGWNTYPDDESGDLDVTA